MSKCLLTLSLSKPRWNSEGILNTHEPFIYGDLYYTGNSFCKNMLKIGWGTRWRSWLRHCATSWKVAGSIPDGVIGIFH